MIQVISPNDDLVLDVVLTDKSGDIIDENLIANIQFVVYTEGTSDLQKIYLSKARYNEGKLFINSSELSSLSSGQIYLTTAIALLNSQYNDGSFDYIKTSALPYYLKNGAMSVSDDEAILQWKIKVTKSLQNIDNALKDFSLRLTNVEISAGDTTAITDLVNGLLTDYATISYVDDQDASIINSIPSAVDLTPYATTDDVQAAIRAIPEPDLTPYATTEDVSTALSIKANRSEIPSLEGYATTDDVSAAIAAIPEVDLTPYATSDDVSTALAEKADKSELFSGSYNDLTNKPTIPTATSFKSFNENWDIYNTVEDFGADVVNDPNAVVGMCYLGALECSNLPEDLGIGDAVVEVKGEGNHNKVIHIEITSTEVYPYKWEGDYWQGSFSGWRTYLMNSDLRGYATTEDVSTAIAAIPEVDLSPYATTADVSTALSTKANTTDLPDLSPYATTEDVSTAIGNIDLSPYATTEDVSTALAEKADISDIPSLEGYATEAYVDGSINAIDLTPYATTEDVSTALAAKANTTDLPDLSPYAMTADVSIALAAKANTTDLPDLSPYATTEDVSTALAAKANTTDLDNYVTDTSLGEILEDYVTDSSLVENYTSHTEMENVEYSVATAVNRLAERVENIEETLLDEDPSTGGDSSTGDDSSTGGGDSSTGETSTGLSFTASPQTATSTDLTNGYAVIDGTALYNGEPLGWTDLAIDWTTGILFLAKDAGSSNLYMPDGNASADIIAFSSSYKVTWSNLANGKDYKIIIPFNFINQYYEDFVIELTTPTGEGGEAV